jgi:hypothetical protein
VTSKLSALKGELWSNPGYAHILKWNCSLHRRRNLLQVRIWYRRYTFLQPCIMRATIMDTHNRYKYLMSSSRLWSGSLGQYEGREAHLLCYLCVSETPFHNIPPVIFGIGVLKRANQLLHRRLTPCSSDRPLAGRWDVGLRCIVPCLEGVVKKSSLRTSIATMRGARFRWSNEAGRVLKRRALLPRFLVSIANMVGVHVYYR